VVFDAVAMSTWVTESFRGTHIQDFASLKGITLDDWTTLCKLTDFTLNGGICDGLDQNTRDDTAIVFPSGNSAALADPAHPHHVLFKSIFFDWAAKRRTKDVEHSIIAKRVIAENSSKRWFCGLEAVYKAVAARDKLFTVEDEVASKKKWVLGFAREAMVGYCEAARLNPWNSNEQFLKIDLDALDEYLHLREQAQVVRNIVRLRFSSSARRARQNAKRSEPTNVNIEGLRRRHKVYYAGRLVFLVRQHSVMVLTLADLDRIQQMLVSTSMVKLYLATAPKTAQGARTETSSAINRELNSLISTAATANYAEAQVVCKAFKKAMDYYQSFVAGELSDERRIDLKKDLNELPSWFELHAFVVRLKRLPLDAAQEAGKMYRILPAPDYDIGQAFAKRANALHAPRLHGDHVHQTSALNMDEFELYLRALILDACAARNKGKGVGTPVGDPPAWWDNWMKNARRPQGIEWVKCVNMRGIVPYVTRETADPNVWKDSAACEEDLDEVMEEREDRDLARRNCLTRLLRDNACPTPETAKDKLRRADHVLRAGFKMEAHKDVGRVFYIGNLADRLVGSEVEHNIGEVAKHMAGYTVGTGLAVVTERIGRCVAPEVTHEQEVFHISSDYEAWSPSMRGDVQRMSHSVWAELFDKDIIAETHRINEGALLALNKRGYTGIVKNTEGNFEGLNGKEMTVLHCALVGYTIYRARRGGLEIPTASFAAFIDDGLLTLVLPRRTGSATFSAFWDFYVETTAFFGFKLDKAKCYLSSRFSIYLNEVYYGGRHVAHALRAVARIGTRAGERCETVTDVMEIIGSGCRGAAKAGINPIQIWKCAIVSQAMELALWGIGSELTGPAAVFFAYAPRAFGCLQAPIGAALDCNFVGAGNIEALANVQAYARRNADVKKWYIKLIRSDFVTPSAATVLQNPNTIRAADHVVKVDYLSPAVSKALPTFVTSKFGKSLLALSEACDAESIAEKILTIGTLISTSTLSALSSASGTNIFTTFVRKLENSGTIARIIGNQQMKSIEDKIRHDLEKTIRRMRNVIFN
jgi:hypothetical protein